jgi:hypothetical protein
MLLRRSRLPRHMQDMSYGRKVKACRYTLSPRLTLPQVKLLLFSYQGSTQYRLNSLLRHCSTQSLRKWWKKRVTRPNRCLMLTRPGRDPPLARFTFGRR